MSTFIPSYDSLRSNRNTSCLETTRGKYKFFIENKKQFIIVRYRSISDSSIDQSHWDVLFVFDKKNNFANNKLGQTVFQIFTILHESNNRFFYIKLLGSEKTINIEKSTNGDITQFSIPQILLLIKTIVTFNLVDKVISFSGQSKKLNLTQDMTNSTLNRINVDSQLKAKARLLSDTSLENKSEDFLDTLAKVHISKIGILEFTLWDTNSSYLVQLTTQFNPDNKIIVCVLNSKDFRKLNTLLTNYSKETNV